MARSEWPGWGFRAFQETRGFLHGGRFRVRGGAAGLGVTEAEAAEIEGLKARARVAAEAGEPALAWALCACEALLLLCGGLERDVAEGALEAAGATAEMCGSLAAFDRAPVPGVLSTGEPAYAPGFLAAAARRARLEPGRPVFQPRGFEGEGPACRARGSCAPFDPGADWLARVVRLTAQGLVEERPEPGGGGAATEARLEVVSWALGLGADPVRAFVAVAAAAFRPGLLLLSAGPLPSGFAELVGAFPPGALRGAGLAPAVWALAAEAREAGPPAPDRLAARTAALLRPLQ